MADEGESLPSPGPRRRPVVFPALIFVACLSYFAWRYWEDGEQIHLLLAIVNGIGLLMMIAARR